MGVGRGDGFLASSLKKAPNPSPDFSLHWGTLYTPSRWHPVCILLTPPPLGLRKKQVIYQLTPGRGWPSPYILKKITQQTIPERHFGISIAPGEGGSIWKWGLPITRPGWVVEIGASLGSGPLIGQVFFLLTSWPLDWIILPNYKETTTNRIKLCFDESSRTSLTGLIVLLRNAMFIFTLMNPVGSILGRRHMGPPKY